MRMFDTHGFAYKILVFLLPYIGAFLIAVSRVCDYRHHWQDVFVGALMGTCVRAEGAAQTVERPRICIPGVSSILPWSR